MSELLLGTWSLDRIGSAGKGLPSGVIVEGELISRPSTGPSGAGTGAGAGAAGNLKSGNPSEGDRGEPRDMLPMLGVLGMVKEPVKRPRRPVILPLRSDGGKEELKRGDGWLEKGRDGLVAAGSGWLASTILGFGEGKQEKGPERT